MEEVGSTSDALKERAERGDGEVALLARRQTGGRGRLGRRWDTVDGNLHLSVLLRPASLRWPGHWSILAAVALAEAVRRYVPEKARLRLKWPNDVLLGAGKLAGILLETGGVARPWLVIGFGVNLLRAPDGLGRPAAAFSAHAPPPPPELFAGDLLRSLDGWRARYATEGFEPVRRAWLRAAHGEGETVTATAGSERIEGRFAGLAGDGALLLETDAGRVAVAAGEVA